VNTMSYVTITIYYAQHISLYRRKILKVVDNNTIIIKNIPEPLNQTIKMEKPLFCVLTFAVTL